MSQAPNPQLVAVYHQIKAGQLTPARDALTAYLRAYPRDADAWWLMAHAVTDPAQVRHCLEKVLVTKPDHAPARARLDALQASAPVPAFDPLRDFELPPNLRSAGRGALVVQDAPARGGGGSWALALAADAPVVSSGAAVRRTPAERQTAQQGRALTLALYGILTVLAVVVVAVLIVEGLDLYRERVVGDTAPGALRGDVFSVQPAGGWTGHCTGDREGQLCSFASETQYDLLGPYTRGSQNLGNEDLLRTINTALFGGGDAPQRAAIGIIMDYASDVSGYDYVLQSLNWQEREYSAKNGRTSYIRGYDLWMEYEIDHPTIDGATGYVYWLTGKDVTGEVLDRRGYFIIGDVYVPREGRMLMLTVVAYSAESIDDLPRAEIEQMIRSINFK
ncbi:hypothetical protein [Aggregatilinea lenta]|uniref:hypothetical protein n=1 Tax=Aggregatilinea lenta TaxID=913108 RepID=UPI000E5AB6C7|nr:hypothetical protein [Aggregatilinea lenta]